MRRAIGVLVLSLLAAVHAGAQGDAVTYRVTLPEPEHHWLQVDATFPAIGPGPLVVRMSRASPGRYAVHEFAKNVFRFEAFDGGGRPLAAERVGADAWRVDGHDGTVRAVYRVFGDVIDGTYLAVDPTHAHINMPAAFVWADGLDHRPIRLEIEPPPERAWRVATQLFAGADPWTFTAPNLQYFMDSPVEVSDLVTSTFDAVAPDGGRREFRIAAHSDGRQADIDALASSVERLVREHAAVFGAFPEFEPGAYTFLLDFVGWAGGDGMEHRNSTSISYPGLSMRTAAGRSEALAIISHEFFHAWNAERIRPAGLEPFDFSRENVTCCLWLAEGFTEYYGDLLLTRAGFASGAPLDVVTGLVNAPGHGVRSAVEMSEQAPFADAGVANDLNDRSRTYVSYYTQGAALALALDLSIRERSGGRLSLDDYMRRLWRAFGAPRGSAPGYVARPYGLDDLRAELAALTGDEAFARAFFARYVEGRETPNFARLLALAGFIVAPLAPDNGWIGNVGVAAVGDGLAVGRDASGRRSLVPFGTPLYRAGIDEGDVIRRIDGQPATPALWAAIARRAPGSRVEMAVERRDGAVQDVTVVVERDPRIRVVSTDANGRTLTVEQRAFRSAWLSSRVP